MKRSSIIEPVIWLFSLYQFLVLYSYFQKRILLQSICKLEYHFLALVIVIFLKMLQVSTFPAAVHLFLNSRYVNFPWKT